MPIRTLGDPDIRVATTGQVHPHVAVLVLNWNQWGLTLECLESVFRLDYPSFTVVLCDNASTDDSVDRIREWASGRSLVVPNVPINPELRYHSEPPVAKPIDLLELDRSTAERGAGRRDARLVLIQNGENLGFAGGNNVGMRYIAARGDMPITWILNNDTVVAADSLRRMVGPLSSPQVTGVGATMMEYNAPAVVQAIAGGAFSWWHILPGLVGEKQVRGRPSAPRVDFISGACILARTTDLKTAGMFDEAFYIYGEDVDLSLKLERQLRGELVHVAGARIWHRGGGEKGYGNPKHDYYTLRNSLLLTRRYYPYMMPAAVAYVLYRFISPKIARRQWVRLRALLRACRDFATGTVGKASI
jgi:GT2 family glycosyltransferase